VGPGQNGATG